MERFSMLDSHSSDEATTPHRRFPDHSSFRASLVDMLRRQVFGPSPKDDQAALSETLIVSPLQLYATGVLFPQRLVQNLLEGGDDGKQGAESDPIQGDLSDVEMKSGRRESGGRSDLGDSTVENEPLNLANEFSPSACGISFRLAAAGSIEVAVSFGTYLSTKITEPHPRAGQIAMNGSPFPATREVPAYPRRHHQKKLSVDVGEKIGKLDPITITADEPDLKLHITVRRRADRGLVVSTMVVNHKTNKPNAICANEDAFFQVTLEITAGGQAAFLPIDRDTGEAADDDELGSQELLYRHRRAFALGHGVAADWDRNEELSVSGRTTSVCSAALPTYELKPILPREQGFSRGDLQLSMGFLYDADGDQDPEPKILEALKRLADDYDSWIEDTLTVAEGLDEGLKKSAIKNLGNCRTCHQRMVQGIEVLSRDSTAMQAFRLMNKAMLIQQYHSSVLRFRELGSPFPEIPAGYKKLPKERKWRPFQLAFILMNISAMTAHDHPERAIVDLIWFPTGGGKTEAYLGLAAYTICIERLAGSSPGVTVLMRYTLRLLTAQQFQRAAALVLALEVLRQDHELGADLGEAPISIGLWVGQSLSPNSRSDATSALRRLQDNRYASNPFQVLQCPWCGVDFTSKPFGYQTVRLPGSTERTVRFICPDEACRFGKTSAGLPVVVIDEDIYDVPPTVLIGTVDKFAQISWNGRVGRLFGIGMDAPPPALVIQDELHLISGPLGTVVGLYETAIDKMCARKGRVHKVVASTATIRRAQEQCWNLYARKAFEFPPQAIRAGESYFAFEDQKSPGRLYVGFLGSAVKSHQTALVRACSPLLQGVCIPINEGDEDQRKIVDPYGTMVWYFNSLRELGHAATLCMGDIPEFLKGLRYRLGVPSDQSRYLREIIELTSRLSADEIPAILQQLEIPWRMKPVGQPAVDVLLATNMIAVGVDVSRLGLIVMSGQPKTTSEYIQATSRVGRQHPGLVLTVYTQTKSRDRSHYERFVGYHQSLYRHVEPTSVTPFSPQARDRGMRGILIALARQLADIETPDLIKDHQEQIEDQVDAILERIRAVDEDEAAEAEEELRDWLKFWTKYSPPDYGRMGGAVDDQTLAFPFGGIRDPRFQREAWPVLTSMRNVDGTCEAQVVNIYDDGEVGQEGA
jgi:hypothetical protein